MGKNAWIHQSVREIFQRSNRIQKNRVCLTSRGCFLSPRAIYCLCAKYWHPYFQSVFKLIIPRPEPLIFSSTTGSVSSLPNFAGNSSITIVPSDVSLSPFFTPNLSHCEVRGLSFKTLYLSWSRPSIPYLHARCCGLLQLDFKWLAQGNHWETCEKLYFVPRNVSLVQNKSYALCDASHVSVPSSRLLGMPLCFV